MNERRLRRRLPDVPLPESHEAVERTWEVVRQAFAERERVTWSRKHLRPLAAAIVLAALAAVAFSPSGRAVLNSIRDAVGREKVVGVKQAAPALVSLPAPGRLLVVARSGAWVVQQSGLKRRLGRYEDASWSPHGLYIVVTRSHEILAVTPDGDVRWSLARAGHVDGARWSPDGFRIAYLDGTNLHVVIGNGLDDRVIAPKVAPAAPAWRPSVPEHELAYAEVDGTIRVVNTDTGAILWRSAAGPLPSTLAWSADGQLLAALSPRRLRLLAGGRLVRQLALRQRRAVAISFAPHGHRLALIERFRFGAGSEVGLVRTPIAKTVQYIFSGAGHFSDVQWSPDGRWLLVGWSSANQWLFIRASGVNKVAPVSNISEQFNPSAVGTAPFPRISGWCCGG
jgi:WD40 repeat protein